MSIIDDRLSSLLSDVTNKIKGLEANIENLNTLAGAVEEMKECLKEIHYRLDTSTLDEEGTDASPKAGRINLLGTRTYCWLW